MKDIYSYKQYLVRRKFFTLFGAKFHVFDPDGQLIFYSLMKAFKLREDIRLYKDENMSQELLYIQARQIIDFSSAYDVIDSQTKQKVGALKRKGWKSIFKDEWIIMDPQDVEIGSIKEDSGLLSFLRRSVTNLIPQKFFVQISGNIIGTYKQNFNPFVLKLTADFSKDEKNLFDHRLGIAAAILLCAIEGRQN
ncbi:MAG TPA: hypothetical protein VK186_08405 [Candidatus Deferrimicrobium sp.]|nr:hypothetical protein [Candidatus Deferrimicrobium sp.]